ncbi:MAG: hypothetical protein ACI9E1_000221 [Cryomorphaceae bacterium]|jgi:hypothetical protein
MSDHIPQAPGPAHLAQLKTGRIVGKSAIIGILVVGILIAAIMVTRHFYQKNTQKMNLVIAEVNDNENVDVPNSDPAPIVEVEPGPDPALKLPGDLELRARAIGQILDARKKRNTDFIEQPGSKEAAIEKAYFSALKQIRDGYVVRLEKSAADTFDTQLELRLLSQAERAKDLDAWIGLLSPDSKMIPRKSSLAFVGNWDAYSSGKVSRRIAHPDGRMEIVSNKEWKVTWQIVKDGTLEVEWGKGRPSILVRDGDGWTGKTPFGHAISFKRGDW